MELEWKYLDELYREKYFDKEVPQVYLKSEADKVIAEMKRQIEFLKTAHDSCGNCNRCADGMGKVFDENLNELKPIVYSFKDLAYIDESEASKYLENPHDHAVYKATEVDKLIAKITKGAISMFRESSCCRGFDLKSPIGKIADAAYKHWMRVDIMQNENKQLKEENSRLLCNNSQLLDRTFRLEKHLLSQNRELRYQKYKRCLAMARWCELKFKINNEFAADAADYMPSYEAGFRRKAKLYERWHKRWLELAERFK